VAICGGTDNATTRITYEARKNPSATTSATSEFYNNSHSPFNIILSMAAAIMGAAANAATSITSKAKNTSATTSANTEFYNKSHSSIIIFPLTAMVFGGGTDNASTRITSEARNTPSATTSSL
jgi:hypothetical protein